MKCTDDCFNCPYPDCAADAQGNIRRVAEVTDKRRLSKNMRTVVKQMLPTNSGYEQFSISPITIINGCVSNAREG